MAVIYPGAVKFIAGSGAVRVCQAVLSCLGSSSKSKKCDKQLTFIVRVIVRYILSFILILVPYFRESKSGSNCQRRERNNV